MELELDNLSQNEVETLIKEKVNFTLSEDAQPLIFKMFTKTLYSNPIGTVVREITSNSFDAHVEAGNNTSDNPVVVRMTKDMSGNYISFIDNGVGMSPDRIKNVYATYFSSTKRSNNDEIGGFGIGGKTPLAYTESFFVITRYEGKMYHYNVLLGEKSPELVLMGEEDTDEVNGTEIRVPVLEVDIPKFENEVIRQLFYFENIVFEGFSETVSNDYKLYRGENFIYRGDQYSNQLHVCLGKVAYPLDFNALEIDPIYLPVALTFNIGDIGVTISRESLEYSKKNVKIIKEKIDALREEMTTRLSEQYVNVRTLSEYYFATINKMSLKLIEDGENTVTVDLDGFVTSTPKDLFPNFIYNELPKIPATTNTDYPRIIARIEMHGRLKNRWADKWKLHVRNLIGSTPSSNVYFSDGDYFKRIRHKKKYILNLHNDDKHFMCVVPKTYENITGMNQTEKLFIHFGINLLDEKTKKYGKSNITFKRAEKLVKQFNEDYIQIARERLTNYDLIEVPEGYVPSIDGSANRISKELKRVKFNLIDAYDSRRSNGVTVEQLLKFKGRIFYGSNEYKYDLRECRNIARQFGIKVYNANNYNSYYYDNDKKQGIMFVKVSSSNEKYLKLHKNTNHINQFYPIIVRRYINKIIGKEVYNRIYQKYSYIESFFKNERFEEINKEMFNLIQEVGVKIQDLNTDIKHVALDYRLIKKWFKIDIEELSKIENLDFYDDYQRCLEYNEKNRENLNMFNIHWGDLSDKMKMLLELALED